MLSTSEKWCFSVCGLWKILTAEENFPWKLDNHMGKKIGCVSVMRTQILIHSFIIDQAPLYVRHWARCWRYRSKKVSPCTQGLFFLVGERHTYTYEPKTYPSWSQLNSLCQHRWTYRGQFAPSEAAKEKVQLCLYIKWMVYVWVFCLFLFWGQGSKKNKCDLQMFIGFTYFNISHMLRR